MANTKIEIHQLIGQIQAAGGSIRLPDPAPAVRAAYRRAINEAVRLGRVPAGMGLRHSGRDRGDLVIRLVSLADDPTIREPRAAVLMPTSLADVPEAFRLLAAHGKGLDVSAAQRDRAVLILGGIATEAARRGYQFALLPADGVTFRLSADDDKYDLTLSEETDLAEVFPEQAVQAKKYDWQRVSPTPARVPSGRLALELDEGYKKRRWRDRSRWTLVDRLPEFLDLIDTRTQESRGQRDRAAEEARARQRTWEAAVPRARERYLADLNRGRLRKQLGCWEEARAMRLYASEIAAHADATDRSADENAPRRDWVAWIREQADLIDPICSPETLAFQTPKQIGSDELDPFMPLGMTARWSPDSGPSRGY